MTLFDPIFIPAELCEATSERAWLEAMLDMERALANAEAALGIVPADAAAAIAAKCDADLYDPVRIAENGRSAGNPAEPLVRALREQVGGEAARWVHWGATSQDVLDTAAMLVARRALWSILDELDRVAVAAARLAETYRSTAMPARTLLQHAVPTTFGLKAAGWLDAVLDVREMLRRICADRLATQLGGAAGTMAALGDRALEVRAQFAAQLELPEAELPWHTNRVRVAELGAALAVAAGAVAKIALDVALLAQTEVGEVREGSGGGSSTMPQKRNPARSAIALACARQTSAHASVLLAALPQEHERAIGGLQSEWNALSGALAAAGGAAASVADALEGLEVDVERMAQNLDATGGAIVAERLSLVLSERLGRVEAHELLAGAIAAGDLEEALAAHLSPGELEELLDPLEYLGAAEELADRALARYREEQEEE